MMTNEEMVGNRFEICPNPDCHEGDDLCTGKECEDCGGNGYISVSDGELSDTEPLDQLEHSKQDDDAP